MRKTFKTVSKFQKSFKTRNSQVVNTDCIRCQVSWFHTLYKNIKSYYYYIIYEIYRGGNFLETLKLFAQTHAPLTFQRFQCVKPFCNSETFLLTLTGHKHRPGNLIPL